MVRDPKALQLFQELYEKAEGNKIPWEPADEGTFVASVGENFTVRSIKYAVEDQWGERSDKYAIVLTDRGGKELIRVTDEVEDVPWFQLQQFHEMARRRAFKVNENIDSFLGELNKL